MDLDSDRAEQQAITRLQEGDISGLEVLVKRYQLQAIRAAYLITHDQALAEDLVQNAFIRVYERIQQFDTNRKFGPWFGRIVVNDAVKSITSQKIKRTVSLDQVLLHKSTTTGEGGEEAAEATLLALLADTAPSPSTLVEQTELRQAVWQALDKLTVEQRAAIVLRYYMDLGETAMAQQLNCPPGTVKWRLHAARERLKTLLAGHNHKHSPDPYKGFEPELDPALQALHLQAQMRGRRGAKK